jgi:hypothetical protein
MWFGRAALGRLKLVSGPDTLWELVFLMVILKIPIAYLCYVVWYAITAKPPPGRGGGAPVRATPEWPPPAPGRLRDTRRRRPPRPHGGPVRAYARSSRAAYARVDRLDRR